MNVTQNQITTRFVSLHVVVEQIVWVSFTSKLMACILWVTELETASNCRIIRLKLIQPDRIESDRIGFSSGSVESNLIVSAAGRIESNELRGIRLSRYSFTSFQQYMNCVRDLMAPQLSIFNE
jgi:hypothetical protein